MAKTLATPRRIKRKRLARRRCASSVWEPGQYFDSESGLAYNVNRYYDPGTGRYRETDPIGLAGGPSTYSYVGANPMNAIDPLGLDPGDIFRSSDAAAVDAGAYARGLTPQFIEYGGWIYPSGKGYTYNLTSGTPRSVPREKLDDLKTQCPTQPIADWHTHPWPSQLPRPKDSESEQNFFSTGDIESAKYDNLPLYLHAPSGVTRVVYPNGVQRVVK